MMSVEELVLAALAALTTPGRNPACARCSSSAA